MSADETHTLSPGTILGNAWRIKSLLGKGACGKVYSVEAVNASSVESFEMVAKCIPYGEGLPKKLAKEQLRISNTLNHERNLLAPGLTLTQFQYRPRLPRNSYHGRDTTHGVVYLIMERLDCDLKGWMTRQPKPSIAEIATVGLQILDGLKWLHAKGWLFVDIKPDNFMLRGQEAIFVDYGLAVRYLSHTGGVRENVGGAFNGTPAYLSLAVLKGSLVARRDEIESLGLVLLAMAEDCELPWSNARSDEEVRVSKETCDMAQLCLERNCAELAEVIALARATPYDKAPDYEAVRAGLIRMRDRPSAAVPIAGSAGAMKDATTAPPAAAAAAAAKGMRGSKTQPKGAAGGAAVPASSCAPPAAAQRGRGAKASASASSSSSAHVALSLAPATATAVPVPVVDLTGADIAGAQSIAPSTGKRAAVPQVSGKAVVRGKKKQQAVASDGRADNIENGSGGIVVNLINTAVGSGRAAGAGIDGGGIVMSAGASSASSFDSTVLKALVTGPFTSSGAASPSAFARAPVTRRRSSLGGEGGGGGGSALEDDRGHCRSSNGDHTTAGSSVDGGAGARSVAEGSGRHRRPLCLPLQPSNVTSGRRQIGLGLAGQQQQPVGDGQDASQLQLQKRLWRGGPFSPSPVRRLSLVVTEGPHAGEEIVLGDSNDVAPASASASGSSGKVISDENFRGFQKMIGRTSAADIVLGNDSCISERHALLMWSWHGQVLDLSFQDNNSSNGTIINDFGLPPKRWATLQAGFKISIGDTELLVKVQELGNCVGASGDHAAVSAKKRRKQI